MQIIVKKKTNQKLATNTIPPSKLPKSEVVRTFSNDPIQYYLNKDGKIKSFTSFRALQYYTQYSLFGNPSYMVIRREDA